MLRVAHRGSGVSMHVLVSPPFYAAVRQRNSVTLDGTLFPRHSWMRPPLPSDKIRTRMLPPLVY
eukprot:4553786-Pyramimonas_sp.AAC.3